MDRHAFTTSLRDHLPAYPTPVAALSRIASPLIRTLPAGHRIEMLRPGHLTLATNRGNVRIRMDLAAQPALESIALDQDPARRVALANLYLRDLLDRVTHHIESYDIGTMTICDLVPAPVDERLTRLPGLNIACRLPDGFNDSARYDNGNPDNPVSIDSAGPQDGDFYCVVEVLSPMLADALRTTHAADVPSPEALLTALHRIPIQTRLRLASRRFPCATLRTLQHGDVLLGWPWQRNTDSDAHSGAKPYVGEGRRMSAQWLWGTAGHVQGRYPVSVEGNRFHIIGMPDMNDERIDLPFADSEVGNLDSITPHAERIDDAVQAHTEDTMVPDTSILDGVDLLVHVEIGCLPMAAADLARVRSGTILTLPENVGHAAVNLVVSGRIVASGELVVVGDQLGVRVHRNGHTHG